MAQAGGQRGEPGNLRVTRYANPTGQAVAAGVVIKTPFPPQSPGNATQHPVTSRDGEEHEHMWVYLSRFVQQKSRPYKSSILP